MSFDLSGFVLHPPRVATGNATTTDEPVNGVSQDYKPLDGAVYQIPSPSLVSLSEDQYRASTLLQAEVETEYLIFAANTSDLRNQGGFEVAGQWEATIGEGELTVIEIVPDVGSPLQTSTEKELSDGTDRVFVADTAGRTIGSITTLVVQRGDTGDEIDLSNHISWNPVTNTATITSEYFLGLLGGGLSSSRGDSVKSIITTIQAPVFWWSKNDQYETRFAWDGQRGRWAPLKGTPVKNLGRLLAGESYTLSPAPKIDVGEFLPGNSSDTDSYSMVRVGRRPDAASDPVAEPAVGGLGGIQVVGDDEVSSFDFSGTELSGVVGQTTGELVWNPSFIEENAGQTVFYSYQGFIQQPQGDPTNIEALGVLEDANNNPLFLAPIPGPTDFPFLRIGNREFLESRLFETDALLDVAEISEGQVGVSLSTGKLRFSPEDLEKADPNSEGFDSLYLGAQVFYDGVSLTQRPVEVMAPVQVVDVFGNPTAVGADNELYLPTARPSPSPGVSGVQYRLDGTGTVPTTSNPGIRPNGSGLVRDIRGPWDMFFFGESGQIRTIRVVDDDDEIPRFAFKIPRGTAIVDLRASSAGSQVILSKEDRSKFGGKPLYFTQTAVQPAIWYGSARMFSRVRKTVTLTGREVFVFRVEGATYTWEASANPGGLLTSEGGTFSVEDIAQSVGSVITGQGSTVVIGDRWAIQTDNEVDGRQWGEIEIGFGPDGEKDLSGPAALGFLPGWVLNIPATETVQNPLGPAQARSLPDNGSNLGVFRSPLNADGRRSDISDVNHTETIDDEVLISSIPASSIVLLDRPPLENFPGYDEGVFFRFQSGLLTRNLKNYEDLVYDFGTRRMFWADERDQLGFVEQPSLELQFDRQMVVGQSFRLPSNGLLISEGGDAFEEQTLNEDFILINGGISGTAALVVFLGASVDLGGRGSFLSGGDIFTDPSSDVDFITSGVKKGYLLQIQSGDAEGTYRVQEDPTSPNELKVSPSFLFTDDAASWEIFEAEDRDTFDSGIVADVQFVQFNHLPEDPFRVRVLSDLGVVPANPQEQEQARLIAVLGDALNSGREISVRFGLPFESPQAALTALTQTMLGSVGSDLSVPVDNRFPVDAFSVRVGSRVYSFAEGDLVKVPSLSSPVEGDIIEVEEATGRLGFGTEVSAQFAGAQVSYVQEFLPASSLLEGQAEYSAATGALNLSGSDLSLYGGTSAYFVERMVSQGGQDVTLNPIQGSFLFSKPLREHQLVEAEYFLAQNGTGDLLLSRPEGDPDAPLAPTRVIEFLPLTVNLEDAVPTTDTSIWKFNPTERLVEEGVAVYIDSTLTNVGSSPVSEVDAERSEILFPEIGVPDTSRVRITYTVLETFGGEVSFTTSRQPVYRPPFRIEADRTQFELETDRTEDIYEGQLLRVGEFAFYITSSTFDPATNLTTVRFTPETQLEAGSRDPSTDSISVLSSEPISADSPNTNNGFWIEIENSYEPVNRGFQEVVFEGNLTSKAIAGHVLEIGGLPFIITGSELIDGGTRTKVSISAFLPRGFNSDQDAVRISGRPVYAPFPEEFLGTGAILTDNPFELILFGEEDSNGETLPGRTLRESVDYQIDFATGSVQFLNPPQGGLRPGQSLYLRRTVQRLLSPVLLDGERVVPRFKADFTHVTTPSEENNLLRGILRAKYTYSQPDSWFYRTTPMRSYLAEVADDVARDVAALLPSQGAVGAVIPPVENKTQGSLGLRSQGQDLEDQDRAARVFLEFYNEAVVAYEQVLETISGDIIGDRDGKFRFFVGKNNEYVPPGYEDSITGGLNRRNIFGELWFGYNRNIILRSSDPLVEPQGASLDGDTVQGRFIDPDLLGDLVGQQRAIIQNDVDDVVLVSRTRKRLRLFPLRLEAFGKYRLLGEPSRFSRIFPERAEAFTLLDPGIGADLESDPIDPGVYAFRKRVRRFSISGNGVTLPKRASTFGKAIGEIANPVLGQFSNISSINARPRLPRARIFAYSPVGFPELDAQIIAAGGIGFSSSPRPAIIATPLTLQDFPIGQGGLPDVDQLAAQGGEVIDLTTGDPDLFTPSFVSGGQLKVAFGKPDGRILDVTTGEQVSFQFPPGTDLITYKSVYVGEVLLGCIATFEDEDGNALTSPDQLLFVSEDSDTTEGTVDLEQGDTFFVTPPDADVIGGGDPNDPSTNAELEAQVQGLPGYRIQFDLRVDRSDGEYEDGTFPSFSDPTFLGLKEILGQRPPTPLSNLEADVRFKNSLIEPLAIPALTGGPLNDSGDYTLPYLIAPNTEKNRLGEAQYALANLFVDSLQPGAIYPDEIQGTDGVVHNVLDGDALPATLTTALNAEPAYVAGQGVGPVRPFDFLLVEVGQSAIASGAQGMLSVGAVEGTDSGSVLEVPRFVTPTPQGERIRYVFENAMAFVNRPASSQPPGIVVSRVGNDTFFDITSISTGFLVFNNGVPALASGGLNTIFNPSGIPYPNNANRVTINLFDPQTSQFLQSVVIDINSGAPEVTGNSGTQAMLVVPTATDNIITVSTAAPFLSIGGGAPPELPEDPDNPGSSIPLEFTVTVDTADSGNVLAAAGSYSASIEEDRLTFREALDLRTAMARNEPPIDGVDVHAKLSVYFVQGAGTDALTVNAPAQVNLNDPFTFPARAQEFTAGGSFEPGIGAGTIKVPSFEGYGNAPLTATGVVFSAIPSSNQDETGVICQGTGVCEASSVDPDYDNRVIEPTLSGGSFDKVQAGDVLVIREDAAGEATTKAGTYLVKYAQGATLPNPYREVVSTTNTVPYNTGGGWAQVRFPRVVSVDMDSASVVVDSVLLNDGSVAFPSSGRIYFVRQLEDITETISLQYLVVDASLNNFEIVQGSGEDVFGNALPDSDFDALAEGTLVSGMTRIEVRLDRASDVSLPDRNLVGHLGDGTYDFAAGGSGFGFREITVGNVSGVPITFTYEREPISGPFDLVAGDPPGPQQIALEEAPVSPTGVFQGTEDAVVYPHVAAVLDLSEVTTTMWDQIHGAGIAPELSTLFPSDTLEANLRLQAGVFLEPTIPRPTQNLGEFTPWVVDADNSLTSARVGFRSSVAFGAPGPTESVSFEVRRIRRFHDVLGQISETLAPLRYVYEIRRGTITFFGAAPVGEGGTWPYVVTANGGTNLGAFDDKDVGILPNDTFRLLDDDGTLLEEIEIAAVESGTQLVLKAPGITKVPLSQISGKPFEIYLRNAPVPQEQNGEQLLDLITDQVLVNRVADMSSQTGGYVAAEDDPLSLRGVWDTDEDQSFLALGIQEGDIVLIDGAGPLEGPSGLPVTGQEYGTRPFGDRSVPGRDEATAGQEVPFQAGGPSELDDNRGFYRVSEVTSKKVSVEASNTFAGAIGGSNVTFGVDTEYAVYPTISDSSAPFAVGNVEGQNDLRPTSFAGENGAIADSFRGNFNSIAPFSYRVIRPSPLFSEEAVDLALMIRERTLSFLDEFGVFFREGKSGDYFVFQRDRHIQDLGDPLIPDEGKGVVSNELVDGVRGNVGLSPFANTSDCLSVLDRRFWINDYRLDNEYPPGQEGATPYSTLESNVNNPSVSEGDGRPVLPDLISDVLDNNDQFRELRLSWLNFRTNREDGTLATIDRFESEFSKRRRNQLRQLRLKKSLEDGA